MIFALAVVVMGLALLAVGWGLLTAIVNRAPGKAQLLFAALVEAVTVIQSVIGLVWIVVGYRPIELATTIGYLIVIVVLIPIAWFWANNERTRFSGVVLAIAAASVAAMTLRLLSLWTAGAAG